MSLMIIICTCTSNTLGKCQFLFGRQGFLGVDPSDLYLFYIICYYSYFLSLVQYSILLLSKHLTRTT